MSRSSSAPARLIAHERGFTLIELLVALTIFAMLAAAGVMLLSGSVSAQGAVKLRLDDMAAMQRANAAISADLGQAVPRISRTEAGTLAPAFFARAPSGQSGGDTAPVMQFVRGGWTNLGDAPRPALQKVEYWVRAGRLERRTYGQVDGAYGDPPAALLEGVRSATLRFRDAGGEWRDRWTPAQPDLMPRAVELTVTRIAAPPLTMLFAVAPGPDPQPVAAPNG